HRVVVAVQGLRLPAALDDAASDELRDGRDAAVENVRERGQPDRETACRPAAEPVLRGRADVEDGLPIEVRRRPRADRQDAAGRELTGRSDGGREPLGPDLAEGRERRELAPGSPVQLAE